MENNYELLETIYFYDENNHIFNSGFVTDIEIKNSAVTGESKKYLIQSVDPSEGDEISLKFKKDEIALSIEMLKVKMINKINDIKIDRDLEIFIDRLKAKYCGSWGIELAEDVNK